MGWWRVGPAGATRDLWVLADGPGRPRYGPWITPAGHDVWSVLATVGPRGLDVGVSWVQQAGSRGTRPTPMLWQSDLSGFKLMTAGMVEFLNGHGAELLTFPDVEVRLRNGGEVPGYVGVLEPVGVPAVVHAEFSDRRTHRIIVDDDIARALKDSRLPGLRLEQMDHTFPGDAADDDNDYEDED